MLLSPENCLSYRFYEINSLPCQPIAVIQTGVCWLTSKGQCLNCNHVCGDLTENHILVYARS